MFAQSLKSFLQFVTMSCKNNRYVEEVAIALSSDGNPLAAMISQLRDGALRIQPSSILDVMDAMEQLGFDWSVHISSMEGPGDDDAVVELCLQVAVLVSQHGDALKGAWTEVFQPMFRLALVTSIARSVLSLAAGHGYYDEDVDELADAVEVAFGALKDVAVAVLSRDNGDGPRQTLYERYLVARDEAEQELLSRFASAGSSDQQHQAAVAKAVADALVRHGVINRLIGLVTDAADRGNTVWLLGRDCDALFIFLRRAGFDNVRYLHGFNREFVRQRSGLAHEIASRLVSPGDVVVDTGFAGTCLAPFRRDGVQTVLISSRQDVRSQHFCLDSHLDDGAAAEVRDAVVHMEHLSIGGAARANDVRFRGGVPVERWNEARYPRHAAFMAAFVRELEALVSVSRSAAA